VCEGNIVPTKKGLLTQTAGNGAATSPLSHDALGRVLSSTQTGDSLSHPFSYEYYLDGSLAKITYPSARVLTYCYDQAGRNVWVSSGSEFTPQACREGRGPTSAQQAYAFGIRYAPHGAVEEMKLGNGLVEWAEFNERLQPKKMGLGPSASSGGVWMLENEYGAAPGTNNGNVTKQWIHAGGPVFPVDYGYDALNRLTSAAEGTKGTNWSQTYGYDPVGNRAVTVLSGPPASPLTPTSLGQYSAKNQIQMGTCPSCFSYDASGNQTQNVLGEQLLYNADDQVTHYIQPGHLWTHQYAYDAEQRRWRRATAGNPEPYTYYIYDALGKLAVEGRVREPALPAGIKYLTRDHLGSTRVVTGAGGTVLARLDYLPFGEEIPNTVGGRNGIPGYGDDATLTQKFTGKERDAGTGLDYFGARYFSAPQGRFTSVDPAMESADPSNPQSWNRYGYALNNPLKFVDRNGRWPSSIHNEIILQAFPGLAREQRAILNRASYDTDYNNRVTGFHPQDPEASFVHGMSDTVHGQSRADAERMGDEFIRHNETLAQQQQLTFEKAGGPDLSPDALRSFGNALHTVTDRTSPTHEGNQPWRGTATLGDKKAAVGHVLGELSMTPQQRERAIREAREAFRKTFGHAAYKRAIQPRKKELWEEDQKIRGRMDR